MCGSVIEKIVNTKKAKQGSHHVMEHEPLGDYSNNVPMDDGSVPGAAQNGG